MANLQRWRTRKNVLANTCRGGATAVVSLALPHFLTRTLGSERFAAWSLLLQMSAVAAYFDFGLQTLLGRLVAQASARNDQDALSRIIHTSTGLLVLAALVPLAACIFLIPSLPFFFHASSAEMLREIRLSTSIVIAGTALSLPLSAFSGVLIGLHRNEIPAAAIGISRLMGAITVILCARHGSSLTILASAYISWNLMAGLAQLVWVKRLLPSLELTTHSFERSLAKTLVGQSLTLTVLSFCMIIISEIDLVIVGHFDFVSVGPYSVATTLTTFLCGLNAAVCAAYYAPIAVMQQQGKGAEIGAALQRLTLVSCLFNVGTVMANLLLGKALLHIWVGATYASQAYPLLRILLLANAIRLIASPFAAGVIATGRYNALISGTLIEAALNLPLSILGALFLGPVGVAYGTLVGAMAGLVWILAFTSRVLASGVMTPASIMSNGLLKPLLAFGPVLLCCLWQFLSSTLSNTVCYLSIAVTVFTLGATLVLGRQRIAPFSPQQRSAFE